MEDKLVVVSGFVEGRLVRFDDSQEVLFSARQLAESPVDLEWDVFDDGRRMVGEAADSTISEMMYVVPYPKSYDALGAHRYMYLSIMGYHTHETKPDLITSSLRIKHIS